MRIRVERAEGIGRITLARPEKKNALDLIAARELREALREFAADASVRVVLLSADGDDFCAGADLSALLANIDADAEAQLQDAEALGDVFRVMRSMPQVVVAAVRGRALAGGAGLATACDIVLAHEGARFGYPEVRVGFVPAMVMALLRRLIGEKRAFELVASGRQVSASEALDLGLVSRVIAADDFEATTEKMIRELAATPSEALRMTKRLFYELDGMSIEDGIAKAARVNVAARSTSDFKRALQRYAPKDVADETG
jgi:methylglutaconyl-CoA hydratase